PLEDRDVLGRVVRRQPPPPTGFLRGWYGGLRMLSSRARHGARRLHACAKRAGPSSAVSKTSLRPCATRSAATRPISGLVSMPHPPCPASQKNPGRVGSSPTT